jgi:hypothetical protein
MCRYRQKGDSMGIMREADAMKGTMEWKFAT